MSTDKKSLKQEEWVKGKEKDMKAPEGEVSDETVNSAIDSAKMVLSGEIPSNQKISQVLDTTKEFLKEKQQEISPPNTKKALGDAAELVEATKNIIEQKNPDEHLQKLASQGVKSVIETGKDQIQSLSKDKDITEKTKQAGNAARRTGQATLNVVKMMLTNGEFRAWFMDFSGFVHDALFQRFQESQEEVQEEQKEEPKKQGKKKRRRRGRGKKAQQQGQQQQQMQEKVCSECSYPTDQCTCWTEETPSQFSGEWTSELKQKLSERFMSLIEKLNKNPEFSSGVLDLFDTLDDLKEKAKKTGEQLKSLIGEEEGDDTQIALDHARGLVERFSGRRLNTLLDSIDRFVSNITQREDLNQWFDDARTLFRDAATDPQNIGGATEFRQRVEQLIDSANNIRREISENDEDFQSIVDETNAIFECIRNDPDVKIFNDKAAKFFENFTYTDPSGKRHINRDLITELRQYVIPLLLKQLEDIPIPKIEDHNEEYEYRIENLFLKGSDIIPERVKIYIDSEFEFNVAQIETEKGCTTALLKVTEIKPKMQGVRFWVNKKTFPSIEDRGIADLSLEDKGASLKVFLQIENLFTDKQTFTFSKAEFLIDTFNIDIIETEHNFITPILSSLWKYKIKTTIEEQAEKKIINMAKSMESGLNNLFTSYPPSRLAHYATEALSSAGEKIGKSLIGESTTSLLGKKEIEQGAEETTTKPATTSA